jgi:hypothetical protein
MIATPRASDADKAGPNQANRGPAVTPAYVAMLGTPRSSRGYDSAEFSGGAGPNPRELVYRLMPTPKASEVEAGNNRSGDRSEETASLSQWLRRELPTPTARDTRSDRASPETMARNSRPLSETSGSLGLTGTEASPVSQRRALLLGLVTWMMGQSSAFLRACETEPSLPLGMRSSARYRKRSEGQ